MTNGPPWINKIEVIGGSGFHLDLDERKRYILNATFARPPGNLFEISITLSIPSNPWPTSGGANKIVGIINDSYPNQYPAHQTHIWFANEDVYIGCYWKPKYNPNDYKWNDAPVFSGILTGNGDGANMVWNVPDSSAPSGTFDVTLQIDIERARDNKSK